MTSKERVMEDFEKHQHPNAPDDIVEMAGEFAENCEGDLFLGGFGGDESPHHVEGVVCNVDGGTVALGLNGTVISSVDLGSNHDSSQITTGARIDYFSEANQGWNDDDYYHGHGDGTMEFYETKPQ